MNDFFRNQNKDEQDLYIELLAITGSLSKLFAESKSPFIYYRAMENIFCKAFNANNLSRNDLSVDASKNGTGIGLKTFLHNNGKTFQKIAEFNKESYLLRDLKKDELIFKVAEMRNERIDVTKRLCDLNDVIYHLVTRSPYQMNIYEEPMDTIELNSIKITSVKKNVVHFTDRFNEYTYSLSKNTLFKRFNVKNNANPLKFKVEILEDPFDFLLKRKDELTTALKTVDDATTFDDYIILPLYSPKSGHVERKSGLNMWNASGRHRDENEVYIPVPSWIHEKKKNFFPYKQDSRTKTDSFNVRLPNNKILSMKVTQQGGKALQSNPNAALGKWILREVLNIKPLQLVTTEMLDRRGIDSVRLSKINNNLYHLDFLKVGSYEDYKADILNEEYSEA